MAIQYPGAQAAAHTPRKSAVCSRSTKFVTVMPYLWNGKGKELLDDEEKVEQRGIEIEKSEK